MAAPRMISYLGVVQFGVWSTLLKILSLVVFFDLEIGNGLRNKVAESLAGGQEVLARSYVFMAKIIIQIWMGDYVIVSLSLVAFVALFVAVSTKNNIFAILLYGIGVVNVRLYTALGAMILNVPLAPLMVKGLNMGVECVVFAATLSLLFSAVLLPLQAIKMIGIEPTDISAA